MQTGKWFVGLYNPLFSISMFKQPVVQFSIDIIRNTKIHVHYSPLTF